MAARKRGARTGQRANKQTIGRSRGKTASGRNANWEAKGLESERQYKNRLVRQSADSIGNKDLSGTSVSVARGAESDKRAAGYRKRLKRYQTRSRAARKKSAANRKKSATKRKK